MSEEKICPIMSRPYLHKFNNDGFTEEETRLHEIKCECERCMAWCPVQLVEWRCTKDIRETEDPCPLDIAVESPAKPMLFCDGCKYWTMFEIKPVLAHCKLIDREFL